MNLNYVIYHLDSRHHLFYWREN